MHTVTFDYGRRTREITDAEYAWRFTRAPQWGSAVNATKIIPSNLRERTGFMGSSGGLPVAEVNESLNGTAYRRTGHWSEAAGLRRSLLPARTRGVTDAEYDLGDIRRQVDWAINYISGIYEVEM